MTLIVEQILDAISICTRFESGNQGLVLLSPVFGARSNNLEKMATADVTIRKLLARLLTVPIQSLSLDAGSPTLFQATHRKCECHEPSLNGETYM